MAIHLSRSHVDIGIVMKKSFQNFNDASRTDFLEDLSFLLACPSSDFYEVKFAAGCVLFLAMIPLVAAMRLIRTFERLKKHPEGQEKPAELKEMAEFIKKYSVSQISSQELDENTTLDELIQKKKRYDSKRQELDQSNPVDKYLKSILFIHGWRWEGEFVTNEIINTFGKLPNFLSAEFQCNHDYFQYPTGITTRTRSFFFVAKALNNFLLGLKRDYINLVEDEETLSDEERATRKRDFKVSIIAHSAGGIVARKCMTLDVFEDELDFVKHITLIASPAAGSGFLTAFAPLPGISDQVRELAKGSAFLTELNSSWSKWREKNPQCQVRCIYGPEDEVVNASDASILDPNAVCVFGVGHSNIKEINDLDDEVYKTVVRFLREVSF